MSVKHRYQKRASLTVEAALVLPIFIFTCYSFLFFFYVIEIQENLHYASTKVCETISSYGYLLHNLDQMEEDKIGEYMDSELESLLYDAADEIIIKELVKRQVVLSRSLESYIVGGYDGISFQNSKMLDEEKFVTIVMSYKLKCPVFKEILPYLPVKQCVKIKSFCGHQADKKREPSISEYVYITENGSVYHTHSDCTYIKIILEMIPYGSLGTQRNSGGAKYYACESCVGDRKKSEDLMNKNVYITRSGTRFHLTTNCSKIKRSTIKVKLSEVDGKKLCSKCELRNGNGK